MHLDHDRDRTVAGRQDQTTGQAGSVGAGEGDVSRGQIDAAGVPAVKTHPVGLGAVAERGGERRRPFRPALGSRPAASAVRLHPAGAPVDQAPAPAGTVDGGYVDQGSVGEAIEADVADEGGVRLGGLVADLGDGRACQRQGHEAGDQSDAQRHDPSPPPNARSTDRPPAGGSSE